MYKIDVHHHVIPPQMADQKWGKGMEVPKWTESLDQAFSKSIGVRTSILSVASPGVTLVKDPEESAALARSLNQYCANLRDENPQGYGFFASVPSLEYPDLAIHELRFALDSPHADGVTLFTYYGHGDAYLGNDAYIPVWEELNARKAVVFVHPINGKDTARCNAKVPEPAFDWPHETGRAAMDMIMNKRLLQFPNVKIILSHGGGTLPALVARSTLVAQPAFGGSISSEDIYEQARSFYFDLALSGSAEVLPLELGFARKGHVLFGSDYPHATEPFAAQMTRFIDGYAMDDAKRREVYHEAAENLFPRLKGRIC
ncbi:2-amino-3-carboxymuconate-6-semialdehyde decarboxylase [Cyphellophora attinorum]|uniref:6-methylsalicylate decarboxylase n=1 Tax=Cyphellophora attinorum TaxID=1664694 RepID=A0A0N1NYL4_9EURO|nr:2-amino-3-carboxymuconate-6-semialdehyde decarboxylase [Phialophora attinorum]KPI37194.1 2-amino-3-carboxymuconate-6-semialdehyde decarboxylase [Phialophora attinorum]